MSKKFIFTGVLASFSLLVLYFAILSLAESFSHAASQFLEMWYWILILAVGFGIQVGLYVFIREKQKMVSSGTVVASGGVSTGAMAACCLRHLTDVLHLMGLAAVAMFLIQYQVWFLILGILSNLVGIAILLEIIQKNNLVGGFLKRVLSYDMSRIKKVTIGASLILLIGSFLFIKNQELLISSEVPSLKEKTLSINLAAKTDSQGGISFTVTPLDFNINTPVKFEIKIDTHFGSLDFDLTKISVLEDENGNQYKPLSWQGSGPGGHHRSGILKFSPISPPPKSITLKISGVGGIKERIFTWPLK